MSLKTVNMPYFYQKFVVKLILYFTLFICKNILIHVIILIINMYTLIDFHHNVHNVNCVNLSSPVKLLVFKSGKQSVFSLHLRNVSKYPSYNRFVKYKDFF